MILAYRIVKSEAWKTHGRDRVRLVLSEDGIEDPKINAVVLDTDDLPARDPADHFSYAFPPHEGKRPKVLVNGVEMFLEVYKKEPTFAAKVDDYEKSQVMWMVMSGMQTGKKGLASVAKSFAAMTVVGVEIVMVVAWE